MAKTSAQRVREYRERKKLLREKLNPPHEKRKPLTSAERAKLYRARKKLLNGQIKHKALTPAERAKRYRDRKKILKARTKKYDQAIQLIGENRKDLYETANISCKQDERNNEEIAEKCELPQKRGTVLEKVDVSISVLL